MLESRKPYDESAVLKRLAAGSVAAFDEIYARYSSSVYQEAFRLLRSREVTRDVVQEVFTILWMKRTHFTSVEHFRAYLVRMGKNLAYHYLLKVSKEVLAKSELSRTLKVQMNGTEHDVHFKELEVLLEETVDLLPQRQREVYEMARNEGLSHEAIARHLNISPHTVKNHLFAAKDFIRRRLQQAVLLIFFFLS